MEEVNFILTEAAEKGLNASCARLDCVLGTEALLGGLKMGGIHPVFKDESCKEP